VLENVERGRPYRAVFYGCLAACGIILLIDPTNQLDQAGEVRWAWGGFMVVGALLSFYGVVRDHWRVEWYGLPLQGSALFGLVFVLIAGGGTTARLAFAFLVASGIPVLLHRFVRLYELAKATKKMVKKQKGER